MCLGRLKHVEVLPDSVKSGPSNLSSDRVGGDSPAPERSTNPRGLEVLAGLCRASAYNKDVYSVPAGDAAPTGDHTAHYLELSVLAEDTPGTP